MYRILVNNQEVYHTDDINEGYDILCMLWDSSWRTQVSTIYHEN